VICLKGGDPDLDWGGIHGSLRQANLDHKAALPAIGRPDRSTMQAHGPFGDCQT
jgi:hypothetical protein